MRDYQKEFKGHCLTCQDYDIFSKSDSTHRGYRCKHHHRPMAMDEKCSSYHFDAIRSNSMIDEAVKFRVKKGYSPSPDKGHWYLVTTICKIVKPDQAKEFIETAREFRANLMDTPEGQVYVANYDYYGIELTQKLLEDYINEATKIETENYVLTVLMPIFYEYNELAKNGQTLEAVKKYIQLLKLVANRYNVLLELKTIDVLDIGVEPYDICADPLFVEAFGPEEETILENFDIVNDNVKTDVNTYIPNAYARVRK